MNEGVNQLYKEAQSNTAQVVDDLHRIARTVAADIGHGELSDDIRKCADRLHVLISPAKFM